MDGGPKVPSLAPPLTTCSLGVTFKGTVERAGGGLKTISVKMSEQLDNTGGSYYSSYPSTLLMKKNLLARCGNTVDLYISLKETENYLQCFSRLIMCLENDTI
jgi:hypothetical protein